jgi:hypothetical protein
MTIQSPVFSGSDYLIFCLFNSGRIYLDETFLSPKIIFEELLVLMTIWDESEKFRSHGSGGDIQKWAFSKASRVTLESRDSNFWPKQDAQLNDNE